MNLKRLYFTGYPMECSLSIVYDIGKYLKRVFYYFISKNCFYLFIIKTYRGIMIKDTLKRRSKGKEKGKNTQQSIMKKRVFQNLTAIALAAIVTVGSCLGTQAMAAAPDTGGKIQAVSGDIAAPEAMDIAGVTDTIKAAPKLQAASSNGGVTMKAGVVNVPYVSSQKGEITTDDYKGGRITLPGDSEFMTTLELSAGELLLYTNLDKTSPKYIKVEVCDASGASLGYDYVDPGQTRGLAINIPVAGTYTLYWKHAVGDTSVCTGGIAAITIPRSEPSEVSSGKTYYVYDADGNDKYYKIVAATPGVITVKAVDESVLSGYLSSARVGLYKSKSPKAELVSSRFTDSKTGTVNYAVKKGTYYIKLSGAKNYIRTLGVKFSKNKNGIGTNTSKKKAASLSTKTVKRILPATGSKSGAYWYKFTLKQNSRNAITIANYSYDTWIKYEVYRGSEKTAFRYGTLYENEEIYLDYYDSHRVFANWTKGTYYVKISRYDKNSNASYTISRAQKTPTPAISKITVGKKKMTVKWAKKGSVDGYQIRYSTSSKMKKAKTVTVKKAKTVSKTISKLTKGKTYYVQIRTYKKLSSYAGGKKNTYYSPWSKAKKSAKIK